MTQENATQPAVLDITSLKERLLAAKDDTEFLAVMAEVAKQKSAMAKAQAEMAQKEAEALAKVREELAEFIRKGIDAAMTDITKRLEDVKATGFTYSPKGKLDANGVPQTKSSVALAVPTVKKRSGGGGGGTGVSTADQTGMNLSDLFDQYASAEEKAEVEAIKADTSIEDKAKNSKMWQVKNKAKKRILADNPNLIKK